MFLVVKYALVGGQLQFRGGNCNVHLAIAQIGAALVLFLFKRIIMHMLPGWAEVDRIFPAVSAGGDTRTPGVVGSFCHFLEHGLIFCQQFIRQCLDFFIVISGIRFIRCFADPQCFLSLVQCIIAEVIAAVAEIRHSILECLGGFVQGTCEGFRIMRIAHSKCISIFLELGNFLLQSFFNSGVWLMQGEHHWRIIRCYGHEFLPFLFAVIDQSLNRFYYEGERLDFGCHHAVSAALLHFVNFIIVSSFADEPEVNVVVSCVDALDGVAPFCDLSGVLHSGKIGVGIEEIGQKCIDLCSVFVIIGKMALGFCFIEAGQGIGIT